MTTQKKTWSKPSMTSVAMANAQISNNVVNTDINVPGVVHLYTS